MLVPNVHYEEIAHIQYKYRVVKPIMSDTRVYGKNIDCSYLCLRPDGILILRTGYACDGCSGPTMDDSSNIHAGFLHDGLYQLLRLGKLAITKKDFDQIRKMADLSFLDQLKLDGMGWIRRNYYYYAVRMFGKKHAIPRGDINV